MKVERKITPWLFSAPALTTYLFVVIIPLIWTLGLSMCTWDGIRKLSFSGIFNYKRLITDEYLHNGIFNNIRFTILSTCYQFFVGLTLAILLDIIKNGKNLLKVIYFVPCIIASVAIAQIFMNLLSVDPMGVINEVLRRIGIRPRSFLGDIKTSLYSVAFVDAYRKVGIYMVILYSGLVSVQKELIEAATIDGCSLFQKYVKIKIPVIKDVSAMVIVLLINDSLKSFELPFVLTNGGPGTSSELVATYMYRTAFSVMRFGYASTIAVFLLCMCLIIVTLLRKLMPKAEIE